MNDAAKMALIVDFSGIARLRIGMIFPYNLPERHIAARIGRVELGNKELCEIGVIAVKFGAISSLKISAALDVAATKADAAKLRRCRVDCIR